MQFSKGGAGDQEKKKQMIIAIVAIVGILGAVGYMASSFMGGGGGGEYVPSETSAPISDSMSGDPSASGDAPTTPADDMTSPPQDVSAGSTGAMTPASTPQSTVTTSAEGSMTFKVFGSVGVTVPKGWKVKPQPGGRSAIFTDGKAFFEVHPPDPKAANPQDMASYALGTITTGASVTGKGEEKIAGNDAFYYTANHGGNAIRITALNAPIRIIFIERMPKGSAASYKPTLDGIRNGITF